MISRTQGTEIKLSDLTVDSNSLSDEAVANEQLTRGRRNILRADSGLNGERKVLHNLG